MKKIIKSIIIVFLFFFVASFLHSKENFPKTGVINIKKIAQTYFKNSQAFRDLEAEKIRNQEYIEKVIADIKELEKKALGAEMNNQDEAVFRYKNEKEKKSEHLREYKRITTQQIEQKFKTLYYSDSFMNELLDAIDKIALKNGFSLIMDVNLNNIYFYTPEIDITDIVIEELMNIK